MVSSSFSPDDSLQSAEMELCAERNINSGADVGGKRCTALSLTIHQFGRVLIVTFVEETGGSLVSRRNTWDVEYGMSARESKLS